MGIEPACFRYDYPIKISGNKYRKRYLSLAGQAGFLFFKAKDFDSLYFHPKNPSYFTLSAGLYTANSFSVGVEFFFWKGLGNRDLFGTKFFLLVIMENNSGYMHHVSITCNSQYTKQRHYFLV